MIEQAQKAQFDEVSQFAEDMIIAKLAERFRLYDKDVDAKVQAIVLLNRKEVKEVREYVMTLHNEIESTTKKFSDELLPVIKDMNQLHSLLIQATDDNKMIFSNLKTVASLLINIMEIVKLIGEMNKPAENIIPINAVGSIDHKTLDSPQKDSLHKENMKSKLDLKSGNFLDPLGKDLLGKGPSGRKMSIAYKPPKDLKNLMHNMTWQPGMNPFNNDVSFKNRIFSRQE